MQSGSQIPDPSLCEAILGNTFIRYIERLKPSHPTIIHRIFKGLHNFNLEKSDIAAKEGQYNPFKLLQSLNSVHDRGDLLLLMDVILQHGGKILRSCLIETVVEKCRESEHNPSLDSAEAIRIITNQLYGENAYEKMEATLKSNSPENILKAVSAKELEKFSEDYTETCKKYIAYMNDGFSLVFYYKELLPLRVKMVELQQALMDGIFSYLDSGNFSKINLPSFFGKSGPAGKLRAEQFLKLLNSLPIEDPANDNKILALFYTVTTSGGIGLNKHLLEAMVGSLPSDTPKTLSNAIDHFFGRDAFACAMNLVEANVLNIDNLHFYSPNKVNYLLSVAIFDYEHYDDLTKKICNHLLNQLLKKIYDTILINNPNLKDKEVVYKGIIQGKVTLEELQEFLKNPPQKSYIEKLPPDLRTLLATDYLGIKPKKK